jgi:hypothetical protein
VSEALEKTYGDGGGGLIRGRERSGFRVFVQMGGESGVNARLNGG